MPETGALRTVRPAHWACCALLLALVACTAPEPPEPSPPPSAAPALRYQPSAESQALARYYAAVESRLLSKGLLRMDGGGVDTAFTARDLSETFERVALFDEYTLSRGRFDRREVESRLRRWEQPIRMRLIFGDSVPAAQRAEDRRMVESFADRLSVLSGRRITLTAGRANFLVLFLDVDEQRAFGDELLRLMPRISPVVVREVTESPRDTFCAAYAMSDSVEGSAYTAAVALIKAEHAGLMRLSCIHEELAQAMGLANDSPLARPSIFNDDEEFALMTRHDELLMRVLYDPRLRPGMTPEEARPIVRRIAAELAAGEV